MYPLFRIVENKHSIFSEKNEQEICDMVRDDLTLFTRVPVKSKEICFTAVKEDPFAIVFVKKPCEELQMLAVAGIAEVIASIDNPSNKVKEYAIHVCYPTLQFIRDKVISVREPVRDPEGNIVGYSNVTSYKLIFDAYHKAKENDDAAFVLSLVPELLSDIKFLKAFKQEINDDFILQFLTDYMLERYLSL